MQGWSGVMRRRAGVAAVLVVMAAASMAANARAAVPGVIPGAIPDGGKAGYVASQEQWRANRAKGLQAPDGWLALVGLEWLKEGENAVGAAKENAQHLPADAPAHVAVIRQNGKVVNGDVKGVTLALETPKGGFPAGFTVDGKPAAAGPLDLHAKLAVGTVSFVFIPRGDQLGLRIRDANAPTRVGFKGLNWYAPDPKFRVQAKWIPYQPEHDVAIGTVIGTTLHEKIPGAAEFVLEGHTLRLEPVVEGKKLFFILRDLTSRTTTYGASRFLYTDLPSNGLDKAGEVTLDLNQLQNPPCAYTNFATCPLPPQQNKLQVEIRAGEKRYREE